MDSGAEARKAIILSPGCFIRAIGRDFPTVTEAEAYARDYLRHEAPHYITNASIFLGAPGCIPVLLWTIAKD